MHVTGDISVLAECRQDLAAGKGFGHGAQQRVGRRGRAHKSTRSRISRGLARCSAQTTLPLRGHREDRRHLLGLEDVEQRAGSNAPSG